MSKAWSSLRAPPLALLKIFLLPPRPRAQNATALGMLGRGTHRERIIACRRAKSTSGGSSTKPSSIGRTERIVGSTEGGSWCSRRGSECRGGGTTECWSWRAAECRRSSKRIVLSGSSKRRGSWCLCSKRGGRSCRSRAKSTSVCAESRCRRGSAKTRRCHWSGSKSGRRTKTRRV